MKNYDVQNCRFFSLDGIHITYQICTVRAIYCKRISCLIIKIICLVYELWNTLYCYLLYSTTAWTQAVTIQIPPKTVLKYINHNVNSLKPRPWIIASDTKRDSSPNILATSIFQFCQLGEKINACKLPQVTTKNYLTIKEMQWSPSC